MKMRSNQFNLFWLAQVFLLLDCIETTQAFPSPGQLDRTINSNRNDTIRGENRPFGSNKETTTFFRYKYQNDNSLRVSADPMQNSIITSSNSDPWGIISTSPKQEGHKSKRKNESNPSRNLRRSFLDGIEFVLEITHSQLVNAYREASPVIPRIKLRKKKQQVVTLVDIEWLKTHEEVLHHRVTNLKEAIQKWDAYRMPLLVDCKSGAILDGHHRYHVGCELGLSQLPVVLVDYLDDDSIDVDVWPDCGIDCLSKEDVIEMSLSNKVFPPKTSRHGFVAEMSPINVPLSQLS